MDADKEALADPVRAQASVLVARDELVELVDLVVLEPGDAREVGGEVLVDLGGLLKGEETELAPQFISLGGDVFAFVPALGVLGSRAGASDGV